MKGLNTISDGIRINNNIELESIEGLSNVSTFSGNLIVYNNRKLKNLKGLNAIHSPIDQVLISNNQSLSSLNGLENIPYINHLQFFRNTALSNLNGLEGLDSIKLDLVISGHSNLTSLDGLQNLKKIGRALRITDNRLLYKIKALAQVDGASLSDLKIFTNPQLSTCNEYSICQYLTTVGLSEIRDNAPGCDTALEIIEACNPITAAEEQEELLATIFPNPTQGPLYLQNFPATATHWQLFNVQGQAVQAGQLDSPPDLSHSPAGVYWITVRGKQFEWKEKIIKL